LGVLAFLGGFATVVITRNVKLSVRFGAVLVLMPVLAGVAYLAAPKSLEGVADRFSNEGAPEEFEVRIEHMLLGFVYVPKFSVLGVGTGYGIPAANPAASVGIVLSEHEPIRMVMELGTFMGSALVLLRYGASVILILASFHAMMLPRWHSFPHAVPLALVLAPTLLFGELIRSAPAISTQVFFCIALISSAILFRREPLDFASAQLSKMR
jgi:hypothetical protein